MSSRRRAFRNTNIINIHTEKDTVSGKKWASKSFNIKDNKR